MGGGRATALIDAETLVRELDSLKVVNSLKRVRSSFSCPYLCILQAAAMIDAEFDANERSHAAAAAAATTTTISETHPVAAAGFGGGGGGGGNGGGDVDELGEEFWSAAEVGSPTRNRHHDH